VIVHTSPPLMSLQYLLQEHGSALSMKDRLHIAQALCYAVSSIHSVKLVHRDIRASNVAVMPDGKLKLMEFSRARDLSEYAADAHRTTTSFGDGRDFSCLPHELQVAFEAALKAHEDDPDLGADGFVIPVSTEADVFMLALTMAGCFTPPYLVLSQEDIKGRLPPKLEDVESSILTGPRGPYLAHLLRAMLLHEPEKRPAMTEVLAHPFFMSWDRLEHQIRAIDTLLSHDRMTIGKQMEEKGLRGVLSSRRFDRIQAMLTQKFLVRPDGGPCSFETSNLRTKILHAPKDIFSVCTMNHSDMRMENGLPHPAPNSTRVVRWVRNVIEHLKGHPHKYHLFRTWARTDRAMDFLIATPEVAPVLLHFWTSQTGALKQARHRHEQERQRWRSMDDEMREEHDFIANVLN